MPDDETTLFRQSWTLYDALSEMNYMFHREIYACVGALLKGVKSGYSLVDLGCGNARFLAPCLKVAPPARYTGIDLSPVALKEAQTYLQGLPEVNLQCQDMLAAMESGSAGYDVIFTGYAVHPLQSGEKQRLLQACSRQLNPGGCLIMVDVVREEGQSRESYLENYLGTMRRSWTQVPPSQLDEACTHVVSFDFPETLSSLRQMAKESSLIGPSVLEHHAQHHVLVFSAE